MQIKKGSTRIVILLGNYAYKFTRIRLLHTAVWALYRLAFRDQRELFRSKFGKNIFVGLCKHLFIGVQQNRTEYAYYRETRDCRVMPTHRILFGGILIIQTRGAAVNRKTLIQNCPFEDTITGNPDLDLHQAKQYCLCQDGKVRAVDYGKRNTVVALRKTLETPKTRLLE